MVTGLRLVTERAGNGVAPVIDTDNGEELMLVHPGVSIVLGNRPPEFPGTLYISNKQILWFSDVDRAKAYAVDFLSVSLHAVSRDPEAYPSPCIFTQIETPAVEDEPEDSDFENETVNLSKITQMRLVPSDPSQLNVLFDVFCQCAELNPDPAEEEEGGNNWILSADQLEDEDEEDEDSEWPIFQNLTSSIGANGNHDLAHSVLQLQINDQRFEDAEEMEQYAESGLH